MGAVFEVPGWKEFTERCQGVVTLQDQMSATLVRNIQAQRQFQEAIDSTRSSLEQMTGGNYSTDVDVDTSAAQQQVDQIQEVLSECE